MTGTSPDVRGERAARTGHREPVVGPRGQPVRLDLTLRPLSGRARPRVSGPSCAGAAGRSRVVYGSVVLRGLDRLASARAPAGSEQRRDWTTQPAFVSVAVLDGATDGAGLDLALATDLRVVTDRARCCPSPGRPRPGGTWLVAPSATPARSTSQSPDARSDRPRGLPPRPGPAAGRRRPASRTRSKRWWPSCSRLTVTSYESSRRCCSALPRPAAHEPSAQRRTRRMRAARTTSDADGAPSS